MVWSSCLCCMVLLQRFSTKHCLTIESYSQCFTLCCVVFLQRYKALSHKWPLFPVLYLVLNGPLAKVQSTNSQLTLIVSALPCAAWSSCKGTVHCSQLILLVSALPCAVWSSCRSTKHCPTIDSYCTAWFSCRGTNTVLEMKLSALYLVPHGPLI